MSQDAQNISAAELYAISFQNPEPKYYSQIPHILSYLTYDFIDPVTGEKTIKKLTLKARELYRVLKMTVGENDFGKCWRNTGNLAELCGMSTGSISNAKDELTQKFHQLDGKSLITITEKPKKTTNKDGIKLNGTEYHEITIIDIWRHNNAFMVTLKYQNNEARSANESADVARSANESALEGARSPDERNKNPPNKNSLSLEQQSMADAVSVVDCLLNKEDSVLIDKKAQACNWFLKIGCDLKTATYFVETYSSDDIYQASMYTEQQLKKKKAKNETIPNIIGYLRNTLKNRYWEKK